LIAEETEHQGATLKTNVGPTLVPAGGVQVNRHVTRRLTFLVEHLLTSSESGERLNFTNSADPVVAAQAFCGRLCSNQVGTERGQQGQEQDEVGKHPEGGGERRGGAGGGTAISAIIVPFISGDESERGSPHFFL